MKSLSSDLKDWLAGRKSLAEGRGFALISTLLIIAVLTIMVVAFMQSMRIDRLTARSYLNKQQADMAANAGVSQAQAFLSRQMTANPYHAIGYTNISTGVASPSTQMTPIIMGNADPNTTPTSQYLISTPTPAALPVFNATNSIDVNKLPGRAGGWIGSPVVAGVLTTNVSKALWINILKNPTLPNQPNKAQPNYNPIVSRYAYWIEDETAKLDYGVAGNNNGTGGIFQRATNSFDIDNLDLHLDVGALPLSAKVPLTPANEAVINNRFVTNRNNAPFLPTDTGWINRYAYPDNSVNIWDDVRFHATPFSLSNELSGSGRRRINLNHLVTNVNAGDAGASGKIAADLDDIVYAISGIHPFPGLNNAANGGILLNQPAEIGMLAGFGNRFYTDPTVPTGGNLKQNHQMGYMLRIAANIRDYIDTDRRPTMVDYQGNISYGTRPNFAWTGGQEPVAIGKEAVPVLQEHAFRFTFRRCDFYAGTPINSRLVDFDLDLYFEFYNPSTKDWVAPAGTQLKIYNLPSVKAQGHPIVQLEDYLLDLSGDVFPAGKTVVITTSPNVASDPPGLILGAATVIRKSGGSNIVPRTYNGKYGNFQVGGGTGDDRRFGLRLDGREGSDDTDYRTEFLLSTPEGYIEAFPFVGIAGITANPMEMTRSANSTQGTWTLPAAARNLRLIWAGSLAGNNAASRSGDARSLSEALTFAAGTASAYGNDNGRFLGTIQGQGAVPGGATFGKAATGYVTSTSWPDYNTTLDDTANTAYAVVRDDAMLSIGELGNIYDPHRKLGDAPTSLTIQERIALARGGGRSLKIGQRDDVVSATRFSVANTSQASWFNAAWRLTDIFCVEDSTEVMGSATAEGKLNINGALRDQGVALRALLRKFTFMNAPETDTNRSGRTISDTEITNLVNGVQSYLQTNGPMMERGELSQLPFFSGAGATNAAGTQQSSTTNDRSREEIFRRVVEIITTRSSSFTVFCIGESVMQKPNGDIQRLAVSRQRVSFTVTPNIGGNVWEKVGGYYVEDYAQSNE